MNPLQFTIEQAFEERQNISPTSASKDLIHAINETLSLLDCGKLRVAEYINNTWVVHEWLKKAILLSFRVYKNHMLEGSAYPSFDKLPLKFQNTNDKQFNDLSLRVVPGAVARFGAFIGKNTILMPSFVNIGAYIDDGVMVDTWATVGSCAQIGKNVHLSGGVGIGGVLEPLQSSPTIIEDNCFIGARSEIVEGVIIERDSVISMGVFIGKSTKIYNRLTGEISYGRVPKGSVVVSGSLPSKDNSYNLNCAVIVKQVDAQTRAKTSINELLRSID